MEQNYTFDVALLLFAPDHPRSIAKKLKTNHMKVVRTLKWLYEQNIVDYNEEGKNKQFFIKKSLEAKNFILMAEHYKLLMLIDKYAILRTIAEKIANDKKIDLALLFGSYAKGSANERSDIDIYIETKNIQIKEDIQKLNSKLSVKIGKYDEEELLIREIEKNHVILKGFEEYYEKTRFFKERS